MSTATTTATQPPPPTELSASVRLHLEEIAKREGFQNFTLNETAGSKPGDGFMAVIRAVEFRGQRTDKRTGVLHEYATLRLVCKLLPQSAERLAVFHSKVVFAREVHFYERLVPMLHRFQVEKGLTAETGFFGYPKCYVAVANEQTDEYVLILQDLRAIGYELWDKSTPMPFENAKLLFQQLGRLNGVSLVLRDQRPEIFAELLQLDDLLTRLIDTKPMRAMCGQSYDQAVELLESPVHKRVMSAIRDNWEDVIRTCTRVTDDYAVLGHGDSWNNNMMFMGQAKICLLDWQVCRFVSPALDIAYFICSSTDHAMRHQHYEQLINVYYSDLVTVVQSCGSNAEKLMPFAEVERQLRSFGRFGIAMAPLLLQVIVSDASNVADMDEMAHEMSKDEVDAKKVTFTNFNPESLAKYRQRLGDVIDDGLRLGWIE